MSSYYPDAALTPPSFYTAAPPAPPPKPSSTASFGPPPPSLPGQIEPSELDANQEQQHYMRSPPPPPPAPQQEFHYQQQQQQIHVPPVEPGWLPAGPADKSTAELSNLLSSPELQSALLSNPSSTHPSVPLSQEPLTALLKSNLALSNQLLHLESELREKRTSTQSRLLALKALEQQHRLKLSETEKELERWSPTALYQRLSASVGEQEGLIKVIESSWLEEEGVATSTEVEGFVRRVKEARKAGFLRRERKARWDEGRVGGWR